jgi:hypothetical protein
LSAKTFFRKLIMEQNWKQWPKDLNEDDFEQLKHQWII